MSARRLSRLAGLVFVLAALLGGVGTQEAMGDGVAATGVSNQIVDWL